MIAINPQLSLPDEEVSFRTSRSSGPGGQNVNKVESRVTLLFDVLASPSLNVEQKELIGQRLARRLNRDGILSVDSQRHRTQAANKDAAIRRFAELLAGALETVAPRKAVKTPKSVKRRRLREKKRRSEKKLLRSRPDPRQE